MKKYLFGLVAISLVSLSGATVIINRETSGRQLSPMRQSIVVNPKPTPTPDCGNRGTCGIPTPGMNSGS